MTINHNKTEITRDPSIPHSCKVLLDVDIQMLLSHQIIKNRVQSESSTVGRIFKEEIANLFQNNPELKVKKDAEGTIKQTLF